MSFERIRLQPSTWHVPPIDIEWDRASGELRGRDAALVREVVEQAIAAGGVSSHPFPTHYAVRDPLHRPAELAAVLGQWWVLSGELASALAAPADDEGEFEVEVVR